MSHEDRLRATPRHNCRSIGGTSTGSSSEPFAIVSAIAVCTSASLSSRARCPTRRIVLGADGIHSVVRTTIVGDGPPRWNGVLMWRGATPSPPFLDGSTMIVAGGTTAKAVVYPIGPALRGLRLTNWAVVVRVAEDGATPPRREDWSRLAELADVQWQLGRFDIAEVDLPGLVATTERIYEYPMCDRDPLPTWTHGNVTLIGDAAHPMYPMGSNGGTQAILDAEAFARHVSTTTSTADALAAYEDERRPVTSAIVAVNRAGGPERVIDLVEARAPTASPGVPTSSTMTSCGPCLPSTAG